ncbi:hypothetical protein FYJ75_12210 [Roseburia sp. MUC/MUC-530-WT-4D]|uniref:BIG2 domain-containing protein n=1 Tax=Roseburia porci TaxID=2605790 RepID=A0A6L5YTQ5_9FIRM|nr:Ig-like domain-containing protein [Roseburia porci]MST75745.1 hypothetical protein [Roseburia porci]
MNIQNITERQFDKTVQRENVSVIDYFNGTKYDVFFRRNNRSVSPEGKVRLYYKQTSKIDYGTTFTLNGKQYIVINQDADESGYFYSAIAKQCNEIVTLAGNEIPVAIDKETFNIQNGSVLNYINGDVTIYAQLNNITSAVAVNDVLQAFGNYYKVGNRFIDGRIVYFNLKQTVKPQDDYYKITYTGATTLDMKESNTYQLTYSVTNNGNVVKNPHISYESSNVEIATVDENGLMTMLKEGSVDIVASCGGATCTTTMTIANTSASTYTLSITSSSDTIKVGGYYKTLTCLFADKDGQDITETVVADMTTADFTWTCFIDGTEYTDNTFVTWKAGTTVNGKKIKLGSDYNYIGQTLTVKVTVNGVTASKDLEITE